ncbi:MAG: alpha/beta hydrolase [Candidatus Hodarchaeales archaeon]|jgi:enterochelin esterase family protein
MKKKLILLTFCLIIVIGSSTLSLGLKSNKSIKTAKFPLKLNQENRVEVFNTLLLELTNVTNNMTKMQKLTEFMTKQQLYGFPVTNDEEIIFIYRINNTLMVEVSGKMTGREILDLVDGTDFFYKQFTFHNDSRGNYGFREDGSSMFKDPLNPDTIIVGQEFTVISDFKMPQYSDDGSYLFSDNIGSVMVNETFFSTNTNHNYTINVYLPAGYNESQSRYASFYAGDGVFYAYAWNGRNILDYLDFYNKTDPLIGIFITPFDYSTNRNPEYTTNRQNYADFIVEELMPYIDSKFRTINDSKSRAHIGSSYGGFFSLYIAAQYPQFFKLVGSQSVSVLSYYPIISGTNYTTMEEYFKHSPKIEDMRFYLNGGTYESGILNEAHKISKTLAEKGYSGKFKAFHQAHDPGQWRATLGELLTFLFTNESSDYSGSPINYGNIQNPTKGEQSSGETSTSETTSYSSEMTSYSIFSIILISITVLVFIRIKKR